MNNDLKINLPCNKFKIKHSLYVREKLYLQEWINMNLYKNINIFSNKKKVFILHDGPPYANGNIHIGHALNKILKDFIIKFKKLSGFYIKFILGWDCHGLPIELMVHKNKYINKTIFLKLCNKYAKNQILKQKNDLFNLGILTNFNKYYYTSNKTYESNIIKSLIEIIKNDFLSYDKKPINWCFKCQSTLSDSELIQKNILIRSVYFSFKILNFLNLEKKFSFFKNNYINGECIINTNTYWLIPLGKKIYLDFNSIFNLLLFKNKIYLISDNITNEFIKILKIKEFSIIGKCKGNYINNIFLYNIFNKKKQKINLFTKNHNQNSIIFASNYNIEEFNILNIKEKKNLINKNGYYIYKFLKKTTIFNSYIYIKYLFNKNDCIFNYKKKNIIYNFCWKHYTPIFYRIISQWFINLNKYNLKESILQEIKKIKNNNIRNELIKAILNRPDWCISRQRQWGVPIPFFINKKNKNLHPNMINILNLISRKFKLNGIYQWNKIKIKHFIKEYKEYKKVNCILDVWFDSGCSIFSINKNFTINSNADLVLEGKDQYRGWFISSIILSFIIKRSISFKDIISHGFVLDKEKKKMSKSLGNVMNPNEVINKFGIEILRLWVSLSDYTNDICISQESLLHSKNIYDKIRNTIKFLLSNVKKTDFIKNDYKKICLIDKFILLKTLNIQNKIINFYENYDFRKCIENIHKFCIFISNEYFEIIKDRLYILNLNQNGRKSCIFTLINIINCITRWIFPILTFTSFEITKYIPCSRYTIFTFKWLNIKNIDFYNLNYWDNILNIKNKIIYFLEKLRSRKIIKNLLDLKIYILIEPKYFFLLNILNKEIKYLFITSEVNMYLYMNTKIKIFYKKLYQNKCIRCWHKVKIIKNKICNRCHNILNNNNIRFLV